MVSATQRKWPPVPMWTGPSWRSIVAKRRVSAADQWWVRCESRGALAVIAEQSAASVATVNSDANADSPVNNSADSPRRKKLDPNSNNNTNGNPTANAATATTVLKCSSNTTKAANSKADLEATVGVLALVAATATTNNTANATTASAVKTRISDTASTATRIAQVPATAATSTVKQCSFNRASARDGPKAAAAANAGIAWCSNALTIVEALHAASTTATGANIAAAEITANATSSADTATTACESNITINNAREPNISNANAREPNIISNNNDNGDTVMHRNRWSTTSAIRIHAKDDGPTVAAVAKARDNDTAANAATDVRAQANAGALQVCDSADGEMVHNATAAAGDVTTDSDAMLKAYYNLNIEGTEESEEVDIADADANSGGAIPSTAIGKHEWDPSDYKSFESS